MPSLIAHLSSSGRRELFQNINYLNIKEYQSFCDTRGIPFRILAETENGNLKQTGDRDRKAMVLARIRKYLETGRTQNPTIYSASIVHLEKVTRFTPGTRICYGTYDKKNPALMNFLKELTDGKFKNGMIARVLLAATWSKGKAPTCKEFARQWKIATDRNDRIHPEAAYLTDIQRGTADKGWKKLRVKKAQAALKVLKTIKKPG